MKKGNRQGKLKSLIEGKVLNTSWGYDMTINEFAKVLEERKSTLKVIMLNKKVIGDTNPAGGKAFPDVNTPSSKPFFLRKHPDFEKSILEIGNVNRLKFVARGSTPKFSDSPKSWWIMDEDKLLGGSYENTWD